MGSELLRIVDTIHRDKNIDKEIIFQGIEQALVSAAKKRLGAMDDIIVQIDRNTGDIKAYDGEQEIDPGTLGRIAALTAKQVMIQKIREAERDVVHDDYEKKIGQLVTGFVQRYERPNVIVNLGKAEAILPAREQVPGETYNPGERVKALVIDVKKVGQKVRIVLSRTHPDILKHLFETEVPEIQERIVEIRAVARDPGHRAKVAVVSFDPKVDCVGACVGIRGSRIKNIVEEMNGEKIDIVRWNDSVEVLIMNAMKPAEIQGILLDYDEKKALVFVEEDQLSLAIGRRGQNVRLASRLAGWAIDIVTGTQDNYQERFVTSRDIIEEEGEAEPAAADVEAGAEGAAPLAETGASTPEIEAKAPLAELGAPALAEQGAPAESAAKDTTVEQTEAKQEGV